MFAPFRGGTPSQSSLWQVSCFVGDAVFLQANLFQTDLDTKIVIGCDERLRRRDGGGGLIGSCAPGLFALSGPYLLNEEGRCYGDLRTGFDE